MVAETNSLLRERSGIRDSDRMADDLIRYVKRAVCIVVIDVCHTRSQAIMTREQVKYQGTMLSRIGDRVVTMGCMCGHRHHVSVSQHAGYRCIDW